MFITISQLKHLIQEEIQNIFLEQDKSSTPEEVLPPTDSDVPSETLPPLVIKQSDLSPGYIPAYKTKPYKRSEEERYVDVSALSPEDIRDYEQLEIEKINQRETERAAHIANIDAHTTGESGDLLPYMDEADLDQAVDQHISRFKPEQLPEAPPEKQPIYIRKRGNKRYFGTPQMKEVMRDLSDAAGGGWYIGDISQYGGGKISGHESHQAGIDADISLPLIGGGMSIKMGGGGKQKDFSFRNIKPEDLDYDRAFEFLLKVAPRAKAVYLDQGFFEGLKAKAKELLDKGLISQTQANRTVFGWKDKKGRRRAPILQVARKGDTHHRDHFHIRLRGVYPEEEWHRKDPEARGQRGVGKKRARLRIKKPATHREPPER